MNEFVDFCALDHGKSFESFDFFSVLTFFLSMVAITVFDRIYISRPCGDIIFSSGPVSIPTNSVVFYLSVTYMSYQRFP